MKATRWNKLRSVIFLSVFADTHSVNVSPLGESVLNNAYEWANKPIDFDAPKSHTNDDDDDDDETAALFEDHQIRVRALSDGTCASSRHDGEKFENMFLNGDHWIYNKDLSTMLTPHWKNCHLFFATTTSDEDDKHLLVYKKPTDDLFSFVQFDSAAAANTVYTSYNKKYSGNALGVYITQPSVAFENDEILDTSNQSDNVYDGNSTDPTQKLGDSQQSFDDAIAMKRFANENSVPYSVKFLVKEIGILYLLNGGLANVVSKEWNFAAHGHSTIRISSKNQIRLFPPNKADGFHYLNRRVVNKLSDGYTFSHEFAFFHNRAGGGNFPAFSLCAEDYWYDEYKSPDHFNPSYYESALCCNGQCTHDIAEKIWLSSLCPIKINNCYNSLVDSCSENTMMCEQLMAVPENQLLGYRAPTPQQNMWYFYGWYDMVGGKKSAAAWKGRWTDGDKISDIDGHHNIPYEGKGHGNGKYRVTWYLDAKKKVGGGVYNSNQLMFKLSVYSHSTKENLETLRVLADGRPERGKMSFSMDLTLAERHLTDIAFRLKSHIWANTVLDYVTVEFLYEDTLEPTSTPSAVPSLSSKPSKRPTRRPTRRPVQPNSPSCDSWWCW